MKQISGTIFNIQRFSVHDGPGIRTTIFFKGCPLACWWCHNPEGRSSQIEKVNGTPIGQKITSRELIGILCKDILFYDESGGGVTFSGGEPLAQPEFLIEMLKLSRANGIRTAVDTCGYADRRYFESILPLTDIFLYDIKLIDPVGHLHYTDVSNIEILENLSYLLQNKAKVIVRLPIVPGITATDENISRIVEFLNKFDMKPEVNMLPFNRIGENKYKRYQFRYRMKDAETKDNNNLKPYASLFEQEGFSVKIGG